METRKGFNTLRNRAATFGHIGERAITRLLVGRSEPTPKSIRDLGHTLAQARPIQLTIEGMNQPPSDVAGWDADGFYHYEGEDGAEQ